MQMLKYRCTVVLFACLLILPASVAAHPTISSGYLCGQVTVNAIGSNELYFQLANTIPKGVYLVMARKPGPYSTWYPFCYLRASATGGPLKVRNRVSEIVRSGNFVFRFTNSVASNLIRQIEFAVGSGFDSDDDGLPDVYEDLVTRTDPRESSTGLSAASDGYGDFDQDTHSNASEFRNSSNPWSWDAPVTPTIDAVRKVTNGLEVSWRVASVTTPPESFRIAVYETEEISSATRQTEIGRPQSRSRPWARPETAKPQRRSILKRTVEVNEPQARLSNLALDGNYHYTITNISDVRNPSVDVEVTFRKSLLRVPSNPSLAGLQESIIRPQKYVSTNGWSLRFTNAAPFGYYLLLVRLHGAECNSSGFFVPRTKEWKVTTDRYGFIPSSQQQPSALSSIHRGSYPIVVPREVFAAVNKEPDSIERLWGRGDLEFVAASGGDLDGDGLPDAYEIFSTGTDATKAASKKSGLLDGYLDLDLDGWTTLQEFRARTNPQLANAPPKEIQRSRPSGKQLSSFLGLTELRDLPWAENVSVKKIGDLGFSPLEGSSLIEFVTLLRSQHPDMLLPYDIKIHYTPPRAEIVEIGGGP
ncbi:MAG: hypothetical protein ACTHMT_01045 [Verrucomicrobiota bacterium]